MTAVVGRALGWVCSWGRSSAASDKTTAGVAEGQGPGRGVSQGLRGWTSWIWAGGWRPPRDQSAPVEEYWEAQERVQPLELEELPTGTDSKHVSTTSRWWSKYLPTAHIPWPGTPRQRKSAGPDGDGDFSEYRTPPPSPTPPSSQLASPFRFFASSWKVEILPEHYDISFNFLRHLFDLFVVGFLWTVSPPAKLILEVLGVQGALRLWLHGMAMFFVSTVGMAGLLWLIQEYLPQFALIYGIIQAAVISVSVKQSVLLGVEEEEKKEEEEEEEQGEGEDEEGKDAEAMADSGTCQEKRLSVKDKVKTN